MILQDLNVMLTRTLHFEQASIIAAVVCSLIVAEAEEAEPKKVVIEMSGAIGRQICVAPDRNSRLRRIVSGGENSNSNEESGGHGNRAECSLPEHAIECFVHDFRT